MFSCESEWLNVMDEDYLSQSLSFSFFLIMIMFEHDDQHLHYMTTPTLNIICVFVWGMHINFGHVNVNKMNEIFNSLNILNKYSNKNEKTNC